MPKLLDAIWFLNWTVPTRQALLDLPALQGDRRGRLDGLLAMR